MRNQKQDGKEKLRQDLTTKQYLAIFTSKMSRGPEHTKVYGHEETNIYCEVSNANIYRLTQMERKKWRVGRREERRGGSASFWWSVDAHRLESLPSPTTMTDQPTRCQHMFLAVICSNSTQPPGSASSTYQGELPRPFFPEGSSMESCAGFGSGERYRCRHPARAHLPSQN